MNLTDVLARLYASEINATVSSPCWDAGWSAWLGSEHEEPRARRDGFADLEDVADWLHLAACQEYPQSRYAQAASVMPCEACHGDLVCQDCGTNISALYPDLDWIDLAVCQVCHASVTNPRDAQGNPRALTEEERTR